jgi:hypothetical protein
VKLREEFWQTCEANVHEKVFSHVRGIEEHQKYVHDANLLHAKLYSNRDLLGLDWGTQITRSGIRPLGPVTENVIQSVIDTATALIAKAKPRPTIVTDGADFTLTRKARKLDRFIFAEYQSHNVYSEAVKTFRDACVFGTGFLKIFADEGKPCFERVMPDEVLVDEREAMAGPPPQMHHRKLVDREVLKGLYPEQKDEIDRAQITDEWKYVSYRNSLVSQIVVIESWYLPIGDMPGRHVICIENETLLDEEWVRDDFPFAVLRWSEPLAGFYGQGLAEQLAGIQLRINKLNKFIDRTQELVATPRFLVPHGSRVKDSHINNAPGSIIHYTGGKPPTVWVGQAVSGEIFKRLEDLKASAFEFAGISMLSAQSRKPAGLESGVALREYSDIETARFAIQSQMYEQFFLECANRLLIVAKEVYQDNSDYSAHWRDDRNNLVKTIKWDSVDMESDRFVLKIEASSVLSKTPAARKSDITDLMAMGAITPEDTMRLLGHPDLDRFRDLEEADQREAEAVVEALLDGELESPEPLQNLPLTIDYVHKAYLKAKRDGAPENILAVMQAWITKARDMLQEAAPPPMPEEMPPPEGGATGPEPPPMAAPAPVM